MPINFERFAAGLYGKDALDKYDRNRALGRSGNPELQNLDASTIQHLLTKKKNQREAVAAAAKAEQDQLDAVRKAQNQRDLAQEFGVPLPVVQGGKISDYGTYRRDEHTRNEAYRDRATKARAAADTAAGTDAAFQSLDLDPALRGAPVPLIKAVLDQRAGAGGGSQAQGQATSQATARFLESQQFTPQAIKFATDLGLSPKEVFDHNEVARKHNNSISSAQLELATYEEIAEKYIQDTARSEEGLGDLAYLSVKRIEDYSNGDLATVLRKIADKNPPHTDDFKRINASTSVDDLAGKIAKLRTSASNAPRGLPFERVDPSTLQQGAQAPPQREDPFGIRNQFGDGTSAAIQGGGSEAQVAAAAAAPQAGAVLPQQEVVQPEVQLNEALAAAEAAAPEPSLPLPEDPRSFRPEYESPSAQQARIIIDEEAAQPLEVPGTQSRRPSERFSEIVSAGRIRRPRDHNAARARASDITGEAPPSSFAARGSRGENAAAPPALTEAQNAAERTAEIVGSGRRPRDHNDFRAAGREEGVEAPPSSFTARGARGENIAEPVETEAQSAAESISEGRRPRDHNAVRAAGREGGGEAEPSSFRARGARGENIAKQAREIIEANDGEKLGFREGAEFGVRGGRGRSEGNIPLSHDLFREAAQNTLGFTGLSFRGPNEQILSKAVQDRVALLEKEALSSGKETTFGYNLANIGAQLLYGLKEFALAPGLSTGSQIVIESTALRIQKANQGREGAGLPPLTLAEQKQLHPSDAEIAALMTIGLGLELGTAGLGGIATKFIKKFILRGAVGGAVGGGPYAAGEAGTTAAAAGESKGEVAKQALVAGAVGTGAGLVLGGAADAALTPLTKGAVKAYSSFRGRSGKGDSPRIEPRTREQTIAANEKRARDAEQSEARRAADDAAAAAEQKEQDDLASGYAKQQEGKEKNVYEDMSEKERLELEAREDKSNNVYEDEPLENRLKDEPEEPKPKPKPAVVVPPAPETIAQAAAAAADPATTPPKKTRKPAVVIPPPTPETIAQAAAAAADPATTPPKKPAVIAPPPPLPEPTPAQAAAAAAAPEAAPKPPKKPRKPAVVAPPPEPELTPAQVAADAAAGEPVVKPPKPPVPPKAKPLTPAQKKRQAEVRRLEREADKAEPQLTEAQIAADTAAGAPREAAAVPDGAPEAPVVGSSTTKNKADRFLKKAQSTRQKTYEQAVAAIRKITRAPLAGKRQLFTQSLPAKDGTKRRVGFKYAVMSADNLITSDQKDYGPFSKLQNRGDVGEVVNQDIVSDISGSNFEADRLGSRDNNLQTGAPIVLDVGGGRFIVLAGNHRTAALRHIRGEGAEGANSRAYDESLERAGFDDLVESAEGKNLSLVRVIDDDLDAADLKALSDLANETQVASQRPDVASAEIGEKILAGVRARRDKNDGIGLETDLNNDAGRRSFLVAVGKSEAQRYRGESSVLNDEGENRFRKVLVSIALGDRDDQLTNDLMKIVSGEADDRIKGPINAIADSAGPLSGLKEAVDGELIASTFDLSVALRQVAFAINQARKDGTSPQDFYANEKALKTGAATKKDKDGTHTVQALGITEEPFDMQDALWKIFFRENKDGTLGRARSAQNASVMLKKYVDEVFDNPDNYNAGKKGSQATFGDDFAIEQNGPDLLKTITRERDQIEPEGDASPGFSFGDDPPNPQ